MVVFIFRLKNKMSEYSYCKLIAFCDKFNSVEVSILDRKTRKLSLPIYKCDRL
jgi:hypothetical protein